MAIRRFRNGPATALVGAIGAADTLCTVASAANFPTLFPYTVILDHGQGTEEIVDVTAAAGNQLTITRGADSSTAFPHGAGAVVVHGVSARDHREANEHVNAVSAVHGVAGALVGTTDSQTLTNKTLTSPAINTATITGGTLTGVTSSLGTFTDPTINSPVVTPKTTANIGLKVRGLASQTSDILQVNNSAESALLRVSSVGRVGINTAPGGAVGLFLKNIAGDLDDLTFRIQLLTGQTGDPFSIVDDVAAVQMKVNTSGHVFTSQVQPLTTAGSLSIGTSAGATVALGGGAGSVTIGAGGTPTNISANGGVVQIGSSSGAGSGSQINLNQNGAGIVSVPGTNKFLIGGESFVVSDTSPGAPTTSRGIWINSSNGVLAFWNGAAWVAA